MGRRVGDVRADRDERRALGFVAPGRQRGLERVEVLGVLDPLHVPAVGLQARRVVLAVEADRRRAVDRDAVVVVADHQLAEPEVPGDRGGFLADALHQVPVGADRVGVVVDDLLARAVEALGEEALGDRHADGVGEALPERPGRDLDPGRVPALGMSRRARAPLAELLEVVEAQLVAGQVQQRVLQHARVAGAQHEAVAVGPVRLGRVGVQEALEDRVRQRRERHRGAGMARVGLLHRVHRETANRVDRQLADLGLLHRTDPSDVQSMVMSEKLLRRRRWDNLCYETFGDPSDPAALLIMGLGTQMVAWQDDFCEELAARGLYVVRFDNRDIGRSTHLQGPPPSLRQLLRYSVPARYTLADMAQDAVGLMDELEIDQAHVIGASMGGMIAQTLAAQAPDAGALAGVDDVQHRRALGRAASALELPDLPAQGSTRARGVRRARRAPVRQGRLPRHPPGHRGRAPDRRALLRPRARPHRRRDASSPRSSPPATAPPSSQRITAPTLVIHGSVDPLVSPSGGARRRARFQARS